MSSLHIFASSAVGSGGYGTSGFKIKSVSEIIENRISGFISDAELWFDTVSGGHYAFEFIFKRNDNDTGATDFAKWRIYHTGDSTAFFAKSNGLLNRCHATSNGPGTVGGSGDFWFRLADLNTTEYAFFTGADTQQPLPFFWMQYVAGFLHVGANGGRFGLEHKPNTSVATTIDKYSLPGSYIAWRKMN